MSVFRSVNNLLIIIVLLINLIASGQLVNADSVIEYSSVCTPDNFTQTGSCNLTCSGNLSSLQDDSAKIVDHSFKYYSTNSEKSVLIFNYSWKQDGDNFVMSLLIPFYYAGTYECEVQIQTSGSTKTYSNPFKIDPNNYGVPLGSVCGSRADCWALNSVCVLYCSCSTQAIVPYDESLDTPACLPIVPSDGKCNTDEQCQIYYYLNYCIYNKCQERSEAKFGLTAGEIAGIVIGCIVLLIVIVSVGSILYKKWTS